MTFYTKVLSRFASTGGLKLTITVDVDPPAHDDVEGGRDESGSSRSEQIVTKSRG